MKYEIKEDSPYVSIYRDGLFLGHLYYGYRDEVFFKQVEDWDELGIVGLCESDILYIHKQMRKLIKNAKVRKES